MTIQGQDVYMYPNTIDDGSEQGANTKRYR